MDPQFLSALIGFGGSIIGALVAYFAANKATAQAHKNQLELEEKRYRVELRSLLQAIHDEIETAWEIYEDYGKVLDSLEDGKPVMMQSPIGVNFTIYAMNCHRIGQIEDHDLRKLIITTYARAFEQVACIQENNRMLTRRDFLLSTDDMSAEHRIEEQQGQLDFYGGVLKRNHFELRKLKDQLLRSLHKRGVLSDSPSQALLTK